MTSEQVQANPRYPDFIICGAPKCGTTSLHFILGQNDDVGMPDNEICYFDADDPMVHPDFLSVEQGKLSWYDIRKSNAHSLAWYGARFERFSDKLRVGEDSPTYLFSQTAPARIHDLLPEVKLIFLLRDPVKRAYSQYWHLMRTSRIACSFEQALVEDRSIILGSTYMPSIKRYLDYFDPRQVKIGIFEDFLSDEQGFVDGMTDFIGVSRMPLDSAQTWFNRSYYPGHPRLHRWANRVGKYIIRGRYRNHMGQRDTRSHKIQHKIHYYWFRYVMPRLLTDPQKPPMREDTAAYLRQHLSARNAGLSDLLQRDLSKIWPGFEG